MNKKNFNFKYFIYFLILLPIFILIYRYTLIEQPDAKIYTEYLIQEGMNKYKEKNFEESIAYFTEAKKFQPENFVIWNNLCASKCEIKLWQEAKDDCEKALILNPDFQLAKNNLDWANSELKNASK